MSLDGMLAPGKRLHNVAVMGCNWIFLHGNRGIVVTYLFLKAMKHTSLFHAGILEINYVLRSSF
jgi:hypothetical protein